MRISKKQWKLSQRVCSVNNAQESTLTSLGAFPGLSKFITSRISLEDVVEKGFKELISHTEDHIKILVSPKKGYLEKG